MTRRKGMRAYGIVTILSAVGIMAVLLGGCWRKPEVETDPVVPPEPPVVVETETVEEVQPPEREETTVFVDPNVEHASVLRPILFDFNKYAITAAARPMLEEIAVLLRENAAWSVLVEGHCDERGTDEYNLALGEQRAQSAVRYLSELGVGKERFQTLSYGEERPAAPGHDEESWALNRRAEFRVEAPGS
ncbi:MAG: OmpA family protein [Gemmatimonadota bacterium]|nr:OmpA family protein [Gemmatimonadota bacterium]MDP6802232.1 OmpA family protein [Gemmatimonadota bacterium]MDP7032153.1 OmpA family protein [Gemmatimonadota bacterium]